MGIDEKKLARKVPLPAKITLGFLLSAAPTIGAGYVLKDRVERNDVELHDHIKESEGYIRDFLLVRQEVSELRKQVDRIESKQDDGFEKLNRRFDHVGRARERTAVGDPP